MMQAKSTNFKLLLAGVSLFVTLICWSLSAPLNSHQDERYHIGSVWCAKNNDELCKRLGTNKFNNEIAIIKADLCVPPNIEETYKRILIQQSENSCRYEFSLNDSLDGFDANPNSYFEMDGSIGVWIYPGHTPSFYFKFMNQFVSENAAGSVVVMRIINALIFCVLLITVLIIANNKVFTSALIAISLTIIPHGLFLIAGINTSGWAYTGSALNWPFLFILLNSRSRNHFKTFIALLGWITTITLVLTSRFDAIVYVFFSNVLLIGLKIFGSKIFSRLLITISSVTTLVIFLILRTQISELHGLFAPTTSHSNQISDLIVVFGNAIKIAVATPLRLLGLQPPGWLFDSVPKLVLLIGLLLAFVVISQIFEATNIAQRKFLFLGLGFYFFILLSQTYVRRDWTTPFYLVRTSWTGDNFHPRYFLPIFPFIIGMTAVLSQQTQTLFVQPRFKNLMITFLTLSHTLTLYKIGSIFRENPSWYWRNFPLGIEAIFVIGSLTFYFFLYLVFYTSKQVET